MIDCITPDAAAALLRDGDMVLAGGNGGSGVPEAVFEAIERRFTAGNGPHDLTLFHVTGVGALTEKGMCHFAHPGLVRRVIGGNFGMQLPFMKMILAQDVEAYNFPQGVMTHLCRAMAGRQPGVLTHVGLETYMDPRQDGGRMNARTTEELVANTHDTILCFSTRGKVYWLKVYQLPEASRGARGRPIINLLPLEEGERITAILPVKEYDAEKYVFFATANGTVKKTSLSDFSRPLSSGIRAINLKEGDELIGVDITDGSNEIMLFSDAGKVVRFNEGSGRADAADVDASDDVETDDDAGNDEDGSDNGESTEGTESKGTFKGVRPMGRTAAGVRGIKLGAGDKVVSLIVPRGVGAILTATENGYGKRTALDEYPTKSRGTQGVISIKVDERNGKVIDAIQVEDTDQIMLITNGGTLVRTRVSEVSVIGRNTGGVRLIRTGEDETVVGLQRVAESDEEETEALAVEGEVSEGTDTAADAGAVDTGEAGDE